MDNMTNTSTKPSGNESSKDSNIDRDPELSVGYSVRITVPVLLVSIVGREKEKFDGYKLADTENTQCKKKIKRNTTLTLNS